MPIDLSTYAGVDLVGDEARNEFRGVMMDLKATFHKTDVYYSVFKTVLDRFNEARKEDADYDNYTLKALVEYSQLVEDKYIFVTEGAEQDARVKVTFNVDYLDQMGLWDDTNNCARFNGIEDKMKINGREYRITEIPVYEGPIEARNIHTVIYAEPGDKLTK